MHQVLVDSFLYRYYLRILYLLYLLFAANACFALPEDKKQIMQFSADFADLNQQSYIGTFKGHVEIDQGTTHVRATEVITKGNAKKQLMKATIKGNNALQAHYWTLPEIAKPIVHAYADTMHYYPEKHRIELIGHARVEQGNNSFTAPSIIYDTLHQHVISKRDGEARTTIIIHPEKHQ